MSELLEMLVEGIKAVIALIIEVAILMVRGSWTVVGLAFSKRFRAAKRTEWAGAPFRKYVTITYSALCLLGIMTFIALNVFSRPESGYLTNVQSVSVGQPSPDGIRQVQLTITNDSGASEVVSFGVKTGAVARILGTKTLAELASEITNNVVPVKKQ